MLRWYPRAECTNAFREDSGPVAAAIGRTAAVGRIFTERHFDGHLPVTEPPSPAEQRTRFVSMFTRR
jgi:hypothetical protein